MRSLSAHIVVFVSGLVGFCLWAQELQLAAAPITHTSVSCPPPRGPILGELKVAQVTFAGSPKLPIWAQEQIGHSIEQKVRGASVESVTAEAVDRVRGALQNRGYFKASATSEGATLNTVPPQTVSLTIRVEEGPQYRLGGITFKNNRAVASTKVLRSLFPIKDGDIFSLDKIAKGLENLRMAYTELGYINFTSIPNTTFSEEGSLAFLDVDVDEGMQFVLRSIDILGVDQATRDQILRDAPLHAGQMFNSRLLELFIKHYPAIFRFPPDDPNHILRDLDEHNGTVAITLDARPCSQE